MGPVEHNQRQHYVSLNSPDGNISGEVFFSTIVLLLVVYRTKAFSLNWYALMWRCGVVVTALVVSTKLLYVEPV